MSQPVDQPLAGRCIALLETREAERLAQMFREQGATVIGCPTVAIVDVADPAPVFAWLGRFTARPPDYLVLMTGEGLQRLHALAQRTNLGSDFVAALARTTTVTRGPKPARALRTLKLAPQLRAETPTTEGVVALLGTLDLRNRRIGVQLYPGAGNRLCDFLEGVGARPDPITPYEYGAAEPDAALAALIGRIVASEIDAIAFTSASQVRRLFAIAQAEGTSDRLVEALTRAAVAAVGPIVGGELQRYGIAPAIVPAGRYFMKPLVTAIATELGPAL